MEASPLLTVRPAPAVIKPLAIIVLLDNVSEPSRVAKVRVPVGIVIVPLLDIVEITGAVNVLLVRVSVVARPTNVSVDEGSERVPAPFTILAIVGVVRVLLENVSEPSRVANVRVPVGIVIVPLLVIVEITGAVNVLLVRVSVVLRPTKVSVLVGRVTVPPFVIVEITGAVNVLLVRVSEVARPTNVSVELGNVRVPPFAMVEITGAVRVLFVRVCDPIKVAILVDKAESDMDWLGSEITPLFTVNPLLTITRPPKEASVPTVRTLPIVALPL